MLKRLSLPLEETGPAEWRAGLKHELIWSAAPGHDNEPIYHVDVRSCPGSARFDKLKELSFDSGGQEMVGCVSNLVEILWRRSPSMWISA